MTEETKSEKQSCGSKKRLMFAYGVIQLGTRVVSALSLVIIALSFSSFKQESRLFSNCVQEIQANGKNSSQAVHFCNGGR